MTKDKQTLEYKMRPEDIDDLKKMHSLSDCQIRGCRNLEWRCADCGRIANTANVPESEKTFLGTDDLRSLSDESFRLFVLFWQLSRDVSYEGPISLEYVHEKIDRLKHRIPIILHPNLEAFMIELKDKLFDN